MSSNVNQSSIHSPLDSNRHQLRLLILHQGQQDEPIHCSLKACFISDQEPYEALSYVWGDATITTPIYIGPLHKLFNVTINLACALSHLRYHDKDRILWVDAVCIDQSNDSEKSHQVRMMRDIFGGAERVLAWLGPETSGAEATFQTIELLASDMRLHWRADGRSDRVGPSITAEQLLGLYTLFRSSDWWNRIWTVQEYAVAQELVFLCGRFSINGQQIYGLSHSIFLHHICCPRRSTPVANTQIYLEEPISRILGEINFIGYQKAIRFVPHHVLWWICTFRTRQASRPEDMVFGLAGLIDGFDEETIKYGTSVEVVYENFSRFMIETSRSLDSLTHVAHACTVPLNISIPTQTAILPSWVVNLNSDTSGRLSRVLSKRQDQLSLYDTSGKRYRNGLISRKGLLAAYGVISDTIATVGEVFDEDRGRANATIFKSWYRMANTLSGVEYSTGGTLENAFWRTICADIMPHAPDPAKLEPEPYKNDLRAVDKDYQVYRLWWHEVEATSQIHARSRIEFMDGLSIKSSVSAFDYQVSYSTLFRRFFISEKGCIGLAPVGAEPGDRISVLFGGRVPYILRENQTDNPSNWTFIGDSYVHGIMDGEVIEKLEAGEVKSEVITLK